MTANEGNVPVGAPERVPADDLGRNAAWRGFNELLAQGAVGPEYARLVPDDDAPQMDMAPEGVSRRQALQLLGGSLALGGLAACTRQPEELILPYSRDPSDVAPGKALFFATAMPWASGAIGLLVESHMGRPTKIEGNPDHPASHGATDALTQAAVLDLYDPGRSQVVRRRGTISTWDEFSRVLGERLETLPGGRGLRVLTRTVVSPTMAGQLERLAERLPEARWHQYEPVNRDRERAGAVLAFGDDLAPRYDFAAARVILALDADFLGARPDGVRHARSFAVRRRPGLDGVLAEMSRLYVAESAGTITGASADHRLGRPPAVLEHLVRALATELGVASESTLQLTDDERAWISAVARDLEGAGAEALVVAGEPLSPAAHALVHAMNSRLGAVGTTLTYGPPAALHPVDQVASLRELVTAMQAGEVELLVVLEANPVYDAPADLAFAAAMDKVPMRVHLGLQYDETARLSHWHLPAPHFLESWGDARAFDGTVSIVQPLIAPLYRSRSSIELVANLAGIPSANGHDLVREYWRALIGEEGFEPVWRRALHDGLLRGTAAPPVEPPLRELGSLPPPPARAEGLELVLRPDASVHDGSFAANAWLQELPDPLTKLVWDNALLVAPADALRLGLATGRSARIVANGVEFLAPVWVAPGQPEGAVALALGYGHSTFGALAEGVGIDAYPLRTSAQPWSTPLVSIEPHSKKHRFASAQEHDSMEGRPLALEATFAQYEAREGLGGHKAKYTLLPEVVQTGHQWGMVIDLSSCTGCQACVIACQSENNIPVVGKEEVLRGREMHWIRIDRYFTGSVDTPGTRFQPVPCMHCEKAPCEVVCPVAATVHSHDGLNEMIYNRCVGTRYCSNNCPYKVRRFNFFPYADLRTETLKMQRNPAVTVRTRGVMEKCTYCVQRIRQRGIEARVEGRTLADGEVRTACQQVCPAEAIVFGDVADPSTAVSAKRAQPHHYSLLAELNTQPRTTYLGRITNPNPAVVAIEQGTVEGARAR